MRILFKRLNEKGISGLALGFVLVLMVFSACKKKDRLSASTFNFSITPPAASVARTGTLTLTARGAGDVNPTWSVSASSVGTVSPEIGAVVVFTPVALGVVTVSATYEGLQANSQIGIVTYIPNSNTFDVYTDLGLPSGAGINSDIFDDDGILTELQVGYTPEGVKYQHASNTGAGQFWGVTLGAGLDLSDYSSGTLKFALRLGRAMILGDRLTVQITEPPATIRPFELVNGSNGFNRTSLEWQEISIPLSSFPALDTSSVLNPFAMVTTAITGGPLSYDIDAIRWEK